MNQIYELLDLEIEWKNESDIRNNMCIYYICLEIERWLIS